MILTLPSECQIWLAQGVGNTNSFIEIDSTPLKQSLWTRAVLLSAGVFILSAIVSLWMRQRYLASVSNPIAFINDYIAALADNPRQLLAPLTIDNAPEELVQTATRLTQLGVDIRLALRQKDRLADIGTAVAKINHDLRNILGAATLVSDALEDSNDPRIRAVGPIISNSISEAAQFCQHMLDYLNAQPEPKPLPVQLDALCKELQMAADIPITCQGADLLHVDPMMMKRILLNLSRNASRAGATKITMDIWRAGHLAVIDVSDDGPGIDANMQPHLFRAFFSGQRGSGLGLSIAKDLAVALRGNIKLSRTGPSGSEFRLQLPADILPPHQQASSK